MASTRTARTVLLALGLSAADAFGLSAADALAPTAGAAARSTRPVLQMNSPVGSNVGAGPVNRAAAGPAADPPPILVQGGTLRTWSYRSPAVERVQVILSSQGRPIDAPGL